MKVGYARVSTDEQHLDLQLNALQQTGCDLIFSDRGISGARTDRPGLQHALASLQPGDTLTVWKLDRLGRSLSHLVAIIGELNQAGVRVVSLTEAIDTQSSAGRFTFHLIAALAEFERSLISERTRAGLAAARMRGKRPGRPAILDAEQLEQARGLLMHQPEVAVARRFKVHQRTLQRMLKRARDQRETALTPGNPNDAAGSSLAYECPICMQGTIEAESIATFGRHRAKGLHRKTELPSSPRMSVAGAAVRTRSACQAATMCGIPSCIGAIT
ncbi:recombinase family protein [Burkholderia sp. Bp8998]|uniref:recombinase family protein n=1 Tax=Burkholderia sp. Bp8998 TaxID=2184557 RepID=UPI000F5AF61E|nr:recombinase family protein [Burkholderia sp. Bp8998]RQS19443.1 recombinase family protein [Burkholderia sp. Bp8998]